MDFLQQSISSHIRPTYLLLSVLASSDFATYPFASTIEAFYMNKKTLCSIYRRGAYAAYSARLAKRIKKVRHDSSRIGGQATPGEADY